MRIISGCIYSFFIDVNLFDNELFAVSYVDARRQVGDGKDFTSLYILASYQHTHGAEYHYLACLVALDEEGRTVGPSLHAFHVLDRQVVDAGNTTAKLQAECLCSLCSSEISLEWLHILVVSAKILPGLYP